MAERFGMEDSLNRQMVSYSHGMRQKMMVIAALVHNPTCMDTRRAYDGT